MVTKFDKRPAIVSAQRNNVEIGGTSSQIAALGNVVGTVGLNMDGYTLIGIINPVVSGNSTGSPYAIHMGSNSVKVINVSTVALRPSSGVLLLSAVFVWGRNDLVAGW